MVSRLREQWLNRCEDGIEHFGIEARMIVGTSTGRRVGFAPDITVGPSRRPVDGPCSPLSARPLAGVGALSSNPEPVPSRLASVPPYYPIESTVSRRPRASRSGYYAQAGPDLRRPRFVDDTYLADTVGVRSASTVTIIASAKWSEELAKIVREHRRLFGGRENAPLRGSQFHLVTLKWRSASDRGADGMRTR